MRGFPLWTSIKVSSVLNQLFRFLLKQSYRLHEPSPFYESYLVLSVFCGQNRYEMNFHTAFKTSLIFSIMIVFFYYSNLCPPSPQPVRSSQCESLCVRKITTFPPHSRQNPCYNFLNLNIRQSNRKK